MFIITEIHAARYYTIGALEKLYFQENSKEKISIHTTLL